MKGLLITYASLLNIAMVLILIGIGVLIGSTDFDAGSSGLTLIFVGLGFGAGVLFLVGTPCVVLSITNIISKKPKNPHLIIMVIKLALIPFYIVNFYTWLLIVGGFANPWLMIGIPLVMFLGVSFTYLTLIVTSIYNIAYMLRTHKYKERNLAPLVVHIFLQLFFISDIVSSIILYCKNKSTKETQEPSIV